MPSTQQQEKKSGTISDYTGEFQTFSYAAADGYNTGSTATTTKSTCRQRTKPNHSYRTQAGLASGQSVVIRGTVMDISAGTKQNEQASDFPNGVPVCSDASMSQWMAMFTNSNQPNQLHRRSSDNIGHRLQPQHQNNRHGNDQRKRNVHIDMDSRHLRQLHSLRKLRRH